VAGVAAETKLGAKGMTQRRFEAIAFDLWDTLVVDDSDEIKRELQGLLPKHEQRRELLWQALDHQRSTSREGVHKAYDDGDDAFGAAWHDEHVTWTVKTRLEFVLGKLDRDLPEPVFAELVRAHEEMELEVCPDLAPGCAEALRELAGDYRLAIVSDAIVSPGRCLRELLRMHGVGRYFSAFAFSDEVGRSKPHAAMFEHVASALGVEPAAMVHVGDREHNDVQGARSVGMKTVLFTQSRDCDRDKSQADAFCDSFAELPRILAGLTRESGRG
jgi:putative hydrolase of the HAD superfamily